MRGNAIKPKNIIKIVLAVVAVWLVSVTIHATFSSYADPLEYNDEGLIGFEEADMLRGDAKYTVTVEGGWLEGGNTSGEFAPGDMVYLNWDDDAAEWSEIQNRLSWEFTPVVDFDNSNLSFVMPASDVEVRAVFAPIPALASAEGLFGFYGEYELRDDETPVKVLLTFRNPPIYALIQQGMSEDDATQIVDADHALFMSELEELFGGTDVSYEPSFEINEMIQHVFNGVYVTVPSNLVREILGFESVVRIDRYILAELPESSGPAIEVTTIATPENGTFADPTVVLPGDEIIYTVTVRNTGEEAVADVQFREEIARYVQFQRSTVMGHFDNAVDTAMPISDIDRLTRVGSPMSSISSEGWVTETFDWSIDRLESGESFTLAISTIVREEASVGTRIHSVLGSGTFHVVGEPAFDELELQSPVLAITKASTPASGTAAVPTVVSLGTEINYTITVQNTSEVTARNIRVTDDIPRYLGLRPNGISLLGYFNDDAPVSIFELDRIHPTMTSSLTPPDYYPVRQNLTIGWEIDRLEPGESFTKIISTVVLGDVPEETVIRNLASAEFGGLRLSSDATYHIVGSGSGNEGENESGNGGENESGNEGENESGNEGENESGTEGENESGNEGENVIGMLSPTIDRTSDANHYIVVGDEIQFTLTINNPNSFDIYNFLVTEELPEHMTFVEESIQVQRRTEQIQTRLSSEVYTDAPDVVSEYVDGEIRVAFSTLLPGNTYIRFRATVDRSADEQLVEYNPVAGEQTADDNGNDDGNDDGIVEESECSEQLTTCPSETPVRPGTGTSSGSTGSTLPQTGAIAGLSALGGSALLTSGLAAASKKKLRVEKLAAKDSLDKKFENEYNKIFGD